MGEYDNINWQAANYKRGLMGNKRSLTPPIDPVVSQIVGKKVLAQDPRLIKLIVKWKANKPNDSTQPDNLVLDPDFVKELKRIFS